MKKKPQPFIEFHNGRPTLRHYLSHTLLDPALIRVVLRELGGWPLATPFEQVLKEGPARHSPRVLAVAADYVEMIDYSENVKCTI